MNSGMVYLIIVYIVWGTTYLAMRIGVGEGSGFPVYMFGALRCLVAAGLLFGIAKISSKSILPKRQEWFHLILTGLGMWTVSHGLVLVAEQYIDSGFAAVAVSASPIWVLVISMWLDHQRPTAHHLFFVALGFFGVAVLMIPSLRHATIHNAMSLILLFIAPISWAYFALHMKRHPLSLSTFAASAYQHLFGGLGFLVLSLLFREPSPQPTMAAWGAFAFLVVFGSIIAFTSYIKALSLLPAHVVTTNTYVNPIIAIILGWLVLGEKVTLWTGLAIGLVIISVSGILKNGQKLRSRS